MKKLIERLDEVSLCYVSRRLFQSQEISISLSLSLSLSVCVWHRAAGIVIGCQRHDTLL